MQINVCNPTPTLPHKRHCPDANEPWTTPALVDEECQLEESYGLAYDKLDVQGLENLPVFLQQKDEEVDVETSNGRGSRLLTVSAGKYTRCELYGSGCGGELLFECKESKCSTPLLSWRHGWYT